MSKNVFLDLGFSEEDSAGLKLRSYLFMALQESIRASSMSQKKIAAVIGADQPKVSKILKGNFSEFSIERIAEYLQKLGYDIHIETAPCPSKRNIGTVKNRSKAFALVEGSGNVFQDLNFGKESVHLLMRTDLMIAITDIFDSKGWSNAQAARALGVKESRISEMRHGQISKFSVDLLLKFLARLGKHVELKIKDVGKVA
jgi:predicted XRE-type DNA-binding protein